MADDFQTVVHGYTLEELEVGAPQSLLVDGGLRVGLFHRLLQHGVDGPDDGHEHRLQEPDNHLLQMWRKNNCFSPELT